MTIDDQYVGETSYVKTYTEDYDAISGTKRSKSSELLLPRQIYLVTCTNKSPADVPIHLYQYCTHISKQIQLHFNDTGKNPGSLYRLHAYHTRTPKSALYLHFPSERAAL